MKIITGKNILSLIIIYVFLLQAGCSGTAAKPAAASTSAPAAPAAVTTAGVPAVQSAKSSGGIVAEGSVVPVENVTLGFTSPGIVEEIFHKEGDTIKQGDMIVRLKGKERLGASVAQAEQAVLAAQRALDDLNTNAAQAKANYELALANANNALDQATKHRDWKNYRRGDQDEIDTAQAKYIVAQDAVKTAQDNYASVAMLGDEDINRAYLLTVLSAARNARDKAKEELNYLLDKPDKFELDIADGQIAVAQANVDAAQRNLDKVKNGPNPDDLAQVQANLKSAQSGLDAAKTSLTDLSMIAPFDGSVVSNDLDVGQQVSPGVNTVSVANTSQWEVNTTDLSELNIVGIKIGQAVKVTFDAIPGLDLSGKVLRIQSLGVNKQGDITYKVVVQLDQQDERLKWNMTALVTF